MDPLPEYFGDWQLARWMGVTRDALDLMPVHEVAEARIVMSALSRAEHEMNKAHGKGGRKR